MSVVFIQATEADLQPATDLLTECMLPTAGLTDQFPSAYVLAFDLGDLIGIAGLESHGSFGLLRSVAVRHDHRGHSIAHTLVRNRLDYARSRHLQSVFLLTTTAAGFFPKLGFRKFNRAKAPEPILNSHEFASLCPSSATCLQISL